MTNIVKSNISLDEPLEKQELKRAISEKGKILSVILERVEKLKIDLSILKQEYDIKIGRLYLKIDETDLEILKYKRIEDMLDQGFSFLDAQKIVEETLKEHHEKIKEDFHKLDEEEKDFENRKIVSLDEQEEIKKLFHKLAHKYHPDLVNGNEEMMKKVNKAYSEADLETLHAIDLEESVTDSETTTIQLLKLKLIGIDKAIEKANNNLKTLENSEWSILNKNIEKTLKQKRNLLNELADTILTELAKKENQLGELKKKYGQR
ncbi:MAG TPA: DnaJ domain-containing protein [Candidatus Paceibacterota bacterium]|jgi:hypothetical protein|nr:DnaJ domain-containing protein [Candidatus Paceibacterota bacterium]